VSWFWDKKVRNDPAPSPRVPPPMKPLTQQWRVNFTDRRVEVALTFGHSGQTVFLGLSVEQARQFATNLNALANSLEHAFPAEEPK